MWNKEMHRSLFVLFMALYFSQQSSAFLLEQYGVGYGFLQSGILTEAVSDDGETGITGSFNLHFLTAHIRWSDFSYKYGVRLGYTPLARSDADDSVDITHLLISPYFGIPLNENATWKMGLNYMNIRSEGNGGSLTLNNGGGVATFYRPSNNTSATLLNIETGLDIRFRPNWMASVDALFNGLLGDRRNLGIFLSLSYFWNQREGTGYSPYRTPRPRRRRY